jgi:tubulin polyglutamylase TTLL6/13
LGIDIFLDSSCKAWLIEVNQSPSFMTDSPLDYQVKKNLIRDTLHMINLSNKRKNRYNKELKNDMANRLVGKNRMTAEDREELKEKKMRIKDKFENNNMGDFQNLYPLKRGVNKADDVLMDRYEFIFKKAKDICAETTNNMAKLKQKEQEQMKTQSHFKARALKKEKSGQGLPPGVKKPSTT